MSRKGSIVWWNATNVHVNDVVLRTSLDAVKPEYGKLVRRPKAAFSALRHAMGRRQGALEDAWRWVEIGETKDPTTQADVLVAALSESTADAAARTWSAGVRLQVEVDAVTGAINFSRGPADKAEQKACDALAERYRLERGELTQGDVRDIVLKILLGKEDGKGVRIKEGGSLYLLSAPHDEIVEQIRPSFDLAGLYLRFMPVHDESMQQLKADVHAGLLAEIAEVRAEVQKRKENIERGKLTKAETLAARRADLDDLRMKAQLFRSVLAEDLASVEAVLRDAQQLITDTDHALIAAASATL